MNLISPSPKQTQLRLCGGLGSPSEVRKHESQWPKARGACGTEFRGPVTQSLVTWVRLFNLSKCQFPNRMEALVMPAT